MKKDQVFKLLKLGIVITLVLLIFECIFSIDGFTNMINGWITKSSGPWIYLTIGFIMFLQVTILNIPGYVILTASISIGIKTLGWQYILSVVIGYMLGCTFAYWLGRKFGIKAVKWVAGSEEDFNKWSTFLNKKGKLYYFLTILFPIFPDDLLCLVAGSIKFHFGLYTLYNLIGRTIGLITMLLTLNLIGSIGGGFPFMIIVWAVALLIEVVAYIIMRRKIYGNHNNRS